MTRRGARRAVAALVAVLAIGATGCWPKPAEMSVTPKRVELNRKGEMKSLVARVIDRDGQEILPHNPVVWSSSDSNIVSVSPTGMAMALSSGRAMISASILGGTVTDTCEVFVRIIDSLAVHPGVAVMAVGETKSFAATLRDDNAGAIPDVTVYWSTSNPNVASVTQAGVVQALGPGEATLSATYGSVEGEAKIEVLSPEDMAAIRAGEDAESK
ncbi:MAG: Ig-like domain-containing protein [Deltaproteobacteria bacterium]|nr:Ig-like domain-containing protein [bacterium]MCB9476015.1 Ig-like domain-containing protein [Deltaproteobacteria bacterium]MCB9478296.1 Ig-like domain-containing protein [Deltaproteobacteria bacterium]MCB9487152.1 Ig-like domain-containing protein [Deltaproteobacteria bacterium]